MRFIMRKVIIIGVGHHNTLGVIRSLGEAGLKQQIVLLMISKKRNFVCYSKYVSKKNVYLILDTSQIVNVLLNIAKTETEKPVIISCADKYAKIIDENSDILANYYVLPNAGGKGRIIFFQHKEEQFKLAELCGMTIPNNFLLCKGSELEIKRRDLSFPCIIKPLNSCLGSKADIKVCNNESELITAIMTSHSLIRIEEYINKIMEFQLIGCALSNTIIIPGYTSIIRQPKNTNTGYLKYSPITDGVISEILLEKARSFVSAIGYQGLFSMEFIRDTNGEDFFLEINLRNDGNAYSVTAAGVNLPFIWYKYAGTTQQVIETTIIENGIYWMPEFNDICNVKHIGFWKWLKDFCGSNAYAVFDFKDMAPFISKLFDKLFSRSK